MAKTGVKIETKAFEKYVRRVIRKYRLSIMKELAEHLDNIQHTSMKYIRPSTTSKRWSTYRMAKEQPSVEGQLTERTGRLLKMLRKNTKWDFKERRSQKFGFSYAAAKIAKMRTQYLFKTVKVLDGFNTVKETYRAEIKVDINPSNPLIGYEAGGLYDKASKRRYFTKVTAKQLALRFKHDTGIRGKKRPFITPAAKAEKINLRHQFMARLNELRSLR